MRSAVLDNTVFVSGVAKHGIGAAKVLDAWRSDGFVLITSEPIIEEIARTLEKQGATSQEKDAIIRRLRSNAMVVIVEEDIVACRDRDDNRFLEAAVAGNVDFIVTDDKDLRVLSPFRGIEIVTVNRFLRRLGIARTPRKTAKKRRS